MKRILFLLALICLEKTLHAQTPHTPYIYTIKADSVKITNSCDTAELIIENHTQTVPGFLFNKGRGRTEFRRVMQTINDTLVVIGIDSLRLPYAWLQGGNRFGTIGKFGTLDNNHIDFYTNNSQQMRLTNTGNLLIGTNVDDGYKVQINGLVSLKNNETSNIRSPRFQVLIGDESGNGGSGVLFYGDQAANGPISIATGHGNHFRKIYFQTAGQPGDTAATYNFTYNSNMSHALNIYNFADGRSKLFLTSTGNLLVGAEADNGYRLAVNGTTYSPVFTNSPTFLGGSQGDGAIRLRWGGPGGTFIEFYNQGNTNRRGYISSPSDSRPLGINDNIGFSFFNTPFVSVGTEGYFNAKLNVVTLKNSTIDALNIGLVNGDGLYSDNVLTVKASGNTVLGGTTDNGNKLQVLGSAYIRDTLKMPNLVSQTDMSGYKPVVADANGNVYKMSGWNASAARKSATVTAESYTVPSDVDVVFVNFASGTATISLPSGTLDREITIKNMNTINSVALSGLDANESNTIATRGAITVKFTGSTWVGISKY
jgi:hypothetical protein